MNERIQPMQGGSLDMHQEDINRLKKIFPEVLTDGEKIDFDKLKDLLTEEIDDSPERYNFTWNGKRQAIKQANTPTTGTLLPKKEKSKDWDTTQNLYIEGDNLEVLKLLQKSYAGKVKVIYIDPPYNTGHDFVYKDDFKDSIDNYLEQTGQVDDEGNKLTTNTESNGRFHTDWLNMMYPRLRLAKNLLSPSGIISISIDENEIDNLKKIMNEIFGEKNLVGHITVVNNPRGRSQDKYIATSSEFLLLYSKTQLPAGSVSVDKDNDDIEKDYPEEDTFGKFRLLELRNTHRDFGKFNRPNLYYPFFVSHDGNVSLKRNSDSDIPVYPDWNDGFEGCWTWSYKKSQGNINNVVAKLISGNWKIYRKSYAEKAKKQLKSVWNDKTFYTDKGQSIVSNLLGTKEKVFQSPKSLDFIRQIIKMSGHVKDEIVLDFFSGSATTAHAVMQQNADDGENRKFIMVQLPEKTEEDSSAYKDGYKTIPEIAEERIRRAGDKILNENPDSSIDVGFKVFELAKTNMQQWDSNPEKFDEQLDAYEVMEGNNFVSGRTSEDVVYELLLKQGLELTDPIEKKTIDKADVYVIDHGALYIILGTGFNDNLANFIVQDNSAFSKELITVIFQDVGFEDDSDKLNVLETLKNSGVKDENIFTV